MVAIAVQILGLGYLDEILQNIVPVKIDAPSVEDCIKQRAEFSFAVVLPALNELPQDERAFLDIIVCVIEWDF